MKYKERLQKKLEAVNASEDVITTTVWVANFLYILFNSQSFNSAVSKLMDKIEDALIESIDGAEIIVNPNDRLKNGEIDLLTIVFYMITQRIEVDEAEFVEFLANTPSGVLRKKLFNGVYGASMFSTIQISEFYKFSATTGKSVTACLRDYKARIKELSSERVPNAKDLSDLYASMPADKFLDLMMTFINSGKASTSKSKDASANVINEYKELLGFPENYDIRTFIPTIDIKSLIKLQLFVNSKRSNDALNLFTSRLAVWSLIIEHELPDVDGNKLVIALESNDFGKQVINFKGGEDLSSDVTVSQTFMGRLLALAVVSVAQNPSHEKIINE